MVRRSLASSEGVSPLRPLDGSLEEAAARLGGELGLPVLAGQALR